MITAKEAKRIADNVKLKKRNEAEINTNHYLSTLYEVIKDAANKGQYTKTITLGPEVDENIFLMPNEDDVILISFEYLEKKLYGMGFDVEILRSHYGLGNHMTISW